MTVSAVAAQAEKVEHARSQDADNEAIEDVKFQRDQLMLEISKLKSGLQQQKQDNFQSLDVLKQKDNEIRYLQAQMHKREEEALNKVKAMQNEAM